jgi:predicted Rossmann fold flavoprotein
LDKVRISGGGRCNVTHNCFDPADLVKGYPRGYRELLGPFNRFQPRDTVSWFQARGVSLKAEPDGRMFPTTDNSSTIMDCLTKSAENAGVDIYRLARVDSIVVVGANEGRARFRVELADGSVMNSNLVLIATGNAAVGHTIATSLGHTIVPCVPSLFTFKIADPRLTALSGISVDRAHIQLATDSDHFEQTGPVLITHWGLSGPAVLKLSAWGARALASVRYQARVAINWLPDLTTVECRSLLVKGRDQHGRKAISGSGIEPIPRRLWTLLTERAGIDPELAWSNITKEQLSSLADQITACAFTVSGKGQFKDEFVTCGGVSLREVDFRTMQSRICPGLYFAGEILDIDGITGGYNFQSAWTTGWIAGQSMSAPI